MTSLPGRAAGLPVRARPLLPLLLAGLLLAGALVVSPPLTGEAGAGVSVDLTVQEAEQLELLNDHRRRQGLPPLVVDARAQIDAREWARRLGDAGVVAHDPGQQADCQAASPTCSAWAENVGRAGSHQRVFELFVASSGHERNMRLASGPGEDPFRVGVGVYRSADGVFVVHRFIRCDCSNDGLANWLNDGRRRDLAFAQALYADFLRRSGSVGELESVAAPLAYGVPRRNTVTGLAYSDAWVGAMVDGLYRATLGRAPDPDGRRFWVDSVRSGSRSPADVATALFASDEYYARVGGTDRRWIAALYGALLGRHADGAGLDHWVGTLRHQHRLQVAGAFYQSVESRGRRVRGLYDLLLARRPDAHGLAHWIDELADGQDVRLAIELASSDEYVQRAVARFS